MPGDISPPETGKGTHADIVKLREQETIDEVTAIDGELRIIDCLFRDLESRWARAQKSTAASPIKFRFRLFRARNQIRQIEAEKVMTFDHVRIAFFDQRGESLKRRVLRFLDTRRIDNDQLLPAGVI